MPLARGWRRCWERWARCRGAWLLHCETEMLCAALSDACRRVEASRTRTHVSRGRLIHAATRRGRVRCCSERNRVRCRERWVAFGSSLFGPLQRSATLGRHGPGDIARAHALPVAAAWAWSGDLSALPSAVVRGCPCGLQLVPETLHATPSPPVPGPQHIIGVQSRPTQSEGGRRA